MFLFGQDSDCVNLFIVKACGEHLLKAHEIEECVEISWRKYMYCKRAITTHGLHTFYPLFEVNQEWVIVARV